MSGTINAVNTSLSGQSGTGSFVGSSAPTLNQAVLNGVTDASSAGAGVIGQVIKSVIPYASAISVTNNTPFDLTSISLSAGDYDVWGNIYFQSVGSVTATGNFVWINTVSATQPDLSIVSANTAQGAGVEGVNTVILPHTISTTTTYYLSGTAVFSAGAFTACGGIYARRRR